MEQNNYTSIKEINQTKRAPFTHLSLTDRKRIEFYYCLQFNKNYNGPKITIKYIANQIGCNKSTISRELKKGMYRKSWDGQSAPTNRYVYDVGQRISLENQKRSHYLHKVSNNNIDLLNILKIAKKENSSLENAVFTYYNQLNRTCPVCLKTIYNYIHKKYIKYAGIKLNFYTKEKKAPNTGKSIQKGDNIRQRPIEAEKRFEFGHFEGDLIVGTKGGSKECLFTLTDRMTRLEIAYKIPNKTTKSVVGVLDEIERKIGKERFILFFKTITFDNGTEFKDITGMETSIDDKARRVKTYFADAYSSWQRGTNENANRQLRRFFPKGTDFEKISDSKITEAVNKINYSKHRTIENNLIIETIQKMNSTLMDTIHLLDISNPYLNIKDYLVLN